MIAVGLPWSTSAILNFRLAQPGEQPFLGPPVTFAEARRHNLGKALFLLGGLLAGGLLVAFGAILLMIRD